MRRFKACRSHILTSRPFFQYGLQAASGFGMCFDSGPITVGAGAKTRLKSRINKYTQHFMCRPWSLEQLYATASVSTEVSNPQTHGDWKQYAVAQLCVRQRLPPMFPVFLPRFRVYVVASLHMCVLPYIYGNFLEMLLKLTGIIFKITLYSIYW